MCFQMFGFTSSLTSAVCVCFARIYVLMAAKHERLLVFKSLVYANLGLLCFVYGVKILRFTFSLDSNQILKLFT